MKFSEEERNENKTTWILKCTNKSSILKLKYLRQINIKHKVKGLN